MTMTWMTSLSPFTKAPKSNASSKGAAVVSTNKLKRFFSKTKPNDVTPPSSPEASPQNANTRRPFALAEPVVLFDRVLVPVQIPRGHCYQKTNIVAGNHVPYTRQQVTLARRKVRVYQMIAEDRIYR
ncbi:Aste57867_9060 [Aphanomyces stellatus]|uniref:Aste57867_9060 protein n=1 Tax=Aphanomyces stellatus TaxID=120398 RepID=A0A485KM37_9STRA|nr:hypothetical protein As57867_009024 [Aphanomyces stellatus]VFT85944.1 Aste57867_9060 [Aphanomyces stellatus]